MNYFPFGNINIFYDAKSLTGTGADIFRPNLRKRNLPKLVVDCTVNPFRPYPIPSGWELCLSAFIPHFLQLQLNTKFLLHYCTCKHYYKNSAYPSYPVGWCFMNKISFLLFIYVPLPWHLLCNFIPEKELYRNASESRN